MMGISLWIWKVIHADMGTGFALNRVRIALNRVRFTLIQVRFTLNRVRKLPEFLYWRGIQATPCSLLVGGIYI